MLDAGSGVSGTPTGWPAGSRGQGRAARRLSSLSQLSRWTRAVVDADGAVAFRDDDGSAWLAENGL